MTRWPYSLQESEWFEGFEAEGKQAFLKGVYSLEDMRVLGAKKDW